MQLIINIFEAGLVLDFLFTWVDALFLLFHTLHWGVLGSKTLLSVWNALLLGLRCIKMGAAILDVRVVRVFKLLKLHVDLRKACCHNCCVAAAWLITGDWTTFVDILYALELLLLRDILTLIDGNVLWDVSLRPALSISFMLGPWTGLRLFLIDLFDLLVFLLELSHLLVQVSKPVFFNLLLLSYLGVYFLHLPVDCLD